MKDFSFKRFEAFFIKESKQMMRDPSTFLIAFLLPLIMIFIFGYGVSLDAKHVPIGIVIEDTSPTARNLEQAFLGTPYFSVKTGYHRNQFEEDLIKGKLRGLIVVPVNFSKKILRSTSTTALQSLVDGSEPNTARFVINYTEGVLNNWNQQQQLQNKPYLSNPIQSESRVWFNEELKSRDVLLPGSIAIIMSLIGTLLTALVVAREWERGTMEAMMATPIRIPEMFFAKLIPYFLLGLASMVLCVFISIWIFDVPFRGSYLILLLSTSVFLLAALGLGLFISTTTRSQFISSQISIIVGFLPAFMLSGFIFEINSMPLIIQGLTYLLTPRYFVTILQSSFLSGVPTELLLPNLFVMLLIGCFFLSITAFKMVKRLD